MMALKAGLAAAPMIGGGLDQLTGLEHGGDVTPGQAYVVGEKRPELFVPNAAGRIYRSVNMRGLSFAPQVDALDGVSVDRVLREHAQVFARHVENHMRKMNA